MKIIEIMNIDVLFGGGVLYFADCLFFISVSFQRNVT